MKIEQVKISELKPAEYNPRLMTEKQAEDLTKSIKEFGIVDPIIVNSNPERKNIIVGGHQRINVAKQMGMTEVPVFYIDLDEKKEKELNVRLNKNNGEWDWDTLANNFDIDDLINLGFTSKDLDLLDQDYGTEFELPDGDKEPFQQITFTLSDEQAELIQATIKRAKQSDFGDTGNENSNGNALWWICKSYE
jgi:hypothetical protein